MEVNADELNKIHQIQLDMFICFVSVCKILGLKYYLVHGSLLGAVRNQGFLAWDDDIDVAMSRDDYETFIKKGQALLREGLFLQSYVSEYEYPLGMSKIRNTNTTFMQDSLKNCDVNKGIYIDVFPLDFYPERLLGRWLLRYALASVNYRIESVLCVQKTKTLKSVILGKIAKMIYPSLRIAVLFREALYAKKRKSTTLAIYSGKVSEVGMPSGWFADGIEMIFEGMNVIVPYEYSSYLEKIYGQDPNYSPAEQYIVDNQRVRLSASIIDVNKSYKDYL